MIRFGHPATFGVEMFSFGLLVLVIFYGYVIFIGINLILARNHST
jgi:hypothetical protein